MDWYLRQFLADYIDGDIDFDDVDVEELAECINRIEDILSKSGRHISIIVR